VLRVRRAGAAAFGPALRAPAPRPGRVFGPQVAFSGDGHGDAALPGEDARGRLLGRRAAEVRDRDGRRQRGRRPTVVAGNEIARPRFATLAGGRIIRVWQIGEDLDAPIAGALSTDAGVFHRARAPHGRTDPSSDASGNRGLAAAGRYAAFIWGGGGKNGFVRISVRRFSSKSWAQRHTPRRSQGSAFDVGRRRIAVTVGCCVAVLRSAGSMDDRAACGSRRARQLAALR
jgi:hypothetical protein